MSSWLLIVNGPIASNSAIWLAPTVGGAPLIGGS